VARHAVHHGIAPLPVPEHGTPSYSLPGESGLFQRSLFGDVGDLCLGLDPVDLDMCEQVAGKLPLRVGTVTMAPCLWCQPDLDLPEGRLASGCSPVPANVTVAAIGVLPPVPLVLPGVGRISEQSMR